MPNFHTQCSFSAMCDKEEKEKEKKKLNKIEIFMFGFLDFVKG